MTTRLLSLTISLLCALSVCAQSVSILEAAGWFESAFVKWQPVADAEKYNVYYGSDEISDTKIDDQLIRDYGAYFRADVPGLKAGNYKLKIVPVINGLEGEGAETSRLEVEAHDRSGFAFMNGRVPGAYQSDGTPKNNAVILYITENTKNTVSLDVTGANSNPCVGLQNILDGFKKGRDTRPLILRFVGQITDLSTMLGGDIVVENANNASSYITLEGIGDDAVFDGWGLRIKNASNIEVRNVGTMNCDSGEGDNISLQQDNDYVWVHHCDFFYGHAGGDSDQAKGDGALDCKLSTYVTFSYNHFWDSGKSNLLGLKENTTQGYYISYHHNWYDHSDSRHPRVRFYSAHVYNNYYDGNAKYGVGSTKGSSVFVEKNYFRNCKNPMMISMQGTDTKMGADESNAPTFSKEDGGIIKAYDNFLTGNYTFAPYAAENPIHFDAYVATRREEQVPAAIVSKQGANKYNNFDTDISLMYAYTPHETEQVVEVVTKYAGRMHGGDFKWTFNNAVDDASYAVNQALKNALVSYKTSLKAIQGDGSADGGNTGGDGDGDGGNGGDTGGVIEGDITHNFTTAGKDSKYFQITGNLSTSQGVVSYGGLTLTQCLKIESSTSIRFTTTKSGKLTLVFNPTFSKRIKIDGVAHTVANGVLQVDLEAGEHELLKVDTGNLYFMSLAFVTGVDNVQESAVRLYPNPTTDNLFVATRQAVESIKIYNLAGKTVLQVNNPGESIFVGFLSSGVYLVEMATEAGVIRQRILKK